MVPVILGIMVIDRPHTTEKCIQHLLKWHRDKFIFVAIDNNSNAETKEVLWRYRKDLDLIITNDFNVGCTFSHNQYICLREPGQHVMKVDVDAHVISPDWMDLLLLATKESDFGVIMGRRPNFWHADDRFNFLRKDIRREIRQGYLPVEIVASLHGCVWPFGLIKSELLDRIGYINEAFCIDDTEYGCRALAAGMHSVYLPNVVISQWHHTIGHPDYEEQHHPEYKSYHELYLKHFGAYMEVVPSYLQRTNLRCGSRFDLGSITDPEYQRMSDENWEFCKNYLKNKGKL